MDEKNYEYDVAFSFVKEDEHIAKELNDLLEDRLSTFLYSKRQKEIAGTDGEKTFNEVFGNKSRIVVVLFINEWGQIPWTRIEETAIRNRGFDEGYDFVVFIPVIKSVLPKWLPKSQLWIGYDRWGLNGAASVIEARVQQVGGQPKEEKTTDKAARLKRQIDAEASRKAFLDSISGVEAAIEEVSNLFTVLETMCLEIINSTELQIKCKKINNNSLDICAPGYCLALDWNYEYRNTLDHSYLEISLWHGIPPRAGRSFSKMPRSESKTRYLFDRDWDGNFGWRDTNKSEFIITDRFADILLKELLDKVKEKNLR